jgi:hypothetical protein
MPPLARARGQPDAPGSGMAGLHAPAGRGDDADQVAARPGPDAHAARGQPAPHPSAWAQHPVRVRFPPWPPMVASACTLLVAGQKRLSIQAHLALPEVETRYRTAKEPVARSLWQMIGLLAQALTSAHVAAVTGYTVHGVHTLARRDNQWGPAGVEDRCHRNLGTVGLRSAGQRAALAAALDQPPPDGGVWTGPQAAAWMAATLGRRVHPQRGWEL